MPNGSEDGAQEIVEMSVVLDRFIPHPDVRERHEITIRAPTELVLDVARHVDMQSILMVRAIFWLRAKILGARRPAARRAAGLVADMLALGWGCLADVPGHVFVAGAACQPWQPDVVFSAIAPEQFAAYAEPDRVKIAWTLEAEARGPALTRFATETRVVATDEPARRKFCHYWRRFGIGILMIRRLLLPAIRRQAERRWRSVPPATHARRSS
jgi:hypothetical protein